MKWEIIDKMYPISIVGSIYGFKMAWDDNYRHEGAAMWLFPYLMKK